MTSFWRKPTLKYLPGQFPKNGAVKSAGTAERPEVIRVLLGSWYRDRLNRVCEHEKMKHRIIRLIQKYFLNPPIKVLFAIGLVPAGPAA